ncbi:hypothetical protein SAMN05444481_109140 [Flavobacterium frigidimaris]|nr:hypothetical protein SAMN05444481_109140 [Flavobacterium frigidimaris]
MTIFVILWIIGKLMASSELIYLYMNNVILKTSIFQKLTDKFSHLKS